MNKPELKFSQKCKHNCKKISKILEIRYGGIKDNNTLLSLHRKVDHVLTHYIKTAVFCIKLPSVYKHLSISRTHTLHRCLFVISAKFKRWENLREAQLYKVQEIVWKQNSAFAPSMYNHLLSRSIQQLTSTTRGDCGVGAYLNPL